MSEPKEVKTTAVKESVVKRIRKRKEEMLRNHPEAKTYTVEDLCLRLRFATHCTKGMDACKICRTLKIDLIPVEVYQKLQTENETNLKSYRKVTERLEAENKTLNQSLENHTALMVQFSNQIDALQKSLNDAIKKANAEINQYPKDSISRGRAETETQIELLKRLRVASSAPETLEKEK